MSSYLVTGANRGIGFELVRQLSALPPSQMSTVFAAIRSDAPSQLQELIDTSGGRVVAIKVQVTNRASIDQAAKVAEAKLSGKGLDCLINNAGVQSFAFDGIENMKESDMNDSFAINVVAVHSMISAFLPLLRKGTGKKIVYISSTVGSITDTAKWNTVPSPAYKLTKAAANSLTANYAEALKSEGFTVFPVSPGWLKTDTGTQDADLEVDVGVKATLDIILTAGPESNGRFRNIKANGPSTDPNRPNVYDGKDAAW